MNSPDQVVGVSRRSLLGGAAASLAAGALPFDAGPAVASALRPRRAQGSSSDPGASPYFAVDRQVVPVPEGVQPWGPTWSNDGAHILFQDYHADPVTVWLADVDSQNVHNVRCLTCSMDDRPAISPGFAFIFPDDKRMLQANELGDNAYILECEPSLYECTSYRWLKVDLSASKVSTRQDIGARTYHLAPDGEHIGFTVQRSDQLVMMVARLKRDIDGYSLADVHVVNPPAATGPSDRSSDRWDSGGTLYELKAFTDGGRSIIALGQNYGAANYDQIKIDLVTGETTTLGGGPDWDEDGAPSPDGSLNVVASWRTMHRLDSVGLFRGSRPFIAAPVAAMLAVAWVSSKDGFACDVQPWLIPGRGDSHGALPGQPLNPYSGGDVIGANNLSGQQMWCPDSTSVLLQSRLLGPVTPDASHFERQKGSAPSQLIIGRINREPTEPMPTVPTKVGSWASTPEQYLGSFGRAGTFTADGRYGGTVQITIAGNLGAAVASVTYHDFADEVPDVLVNGTTTSVGSPLNPLRYTSDLVATQAGRQVGHEEIDLTFTPNGAGTLRSAVRSSTDHDLLRPDGKPNVTVTGTASSSWFGAEASGVPPIAPAPGSLPRRTPLTLDAKVTTREIIARVTATIGDVTQPVAGAAVTFDDTTATTDSAGRVTFPRKGHGDSLIHATAGDTFIDTSQMIRR